MSDKTLKQTVEELRKLMDVKGVAPLPWSYGQGRLEPRLGHPEWYIENKTLARAAVNALPMLLAVAEHYGEEAEKMILARMKEDQIIAEAAKIKARRAVVTINK